MRPFWGSETVSSTTAQRQLIYYAKRVVVYKVDRLGGSLPRPRRGLHEGLRRLGVGIGNLAVAQDATSRQGGRWPRHNSQPTNSKNSTISPHDGQKLFPSGPSGTTDPDSMSISEPLSKSPPPPRKDSPREHSNCSSNSKRINSPTNSPVLAAANS